MAISWVQVRTALRSTSIASREDSEAVTSTSSAAAAVVQYLFDGANARSLDYRIDTELARLASQAEEYIPAASSDGVLVFVAITTMTDGSTGISTSRFECAGFAGPPYHSSDSSHALHHFRGGGSLLPSGAGVSSMRYFWGTRR